MINKCNPKKNEKFAAAERCAETLKKNEIIYFIIRIHVVHRAIQGGGRVFEAHGTTRIKPELNLFRRCDSNVHSGQNPVRNFKLSPPIVCLNIFDQFFIENRLKRRTKVRLTQLRRYAHFLETA